MGQESDMKSRLVMEICSLSSRSIACAHRHPFIPSKSHFIDWYPILGVEENASIDVIRRRYHKLALQLHPDKNKHPKSEIAFKLVLEAYSCLSDDARREAFNLERWKNFCIECNRIPYVYCSSLGNSSASKHNGRNAASTNSFRSNHFLQGLKDIRERFKEEAKVMENCLRANAALRKESPIFNPSRNVMQGNSLCKSRKESPVFNPSDYVFEGYPHIRSRMCKQPQNLWHMYRNNVSNLRRGRYDSAIFENRTDRGVFKSKSACVRS